MTKLNQYFEEYPNVSLRKLSQVTGMCYGWLLKKSKEPIEGTPYNPNSVNYEALERVFQSKGIDLDTLDWETMNQENTRSTTLTKDMDKFNVGDKVFLREDNETPYVILYKTTTHVVIMLEGDTVPRSLSNSTFLMKGPSFTQRIKKVVEE